MCPMRLMKKLDHYGIHGYTYNWIRAFLIDRTQQVLDKGAASDSIPVDSGVPQRVLSPLLFLMFINDLADCVQSSTRLYPVPTDQESIRQCDTPGRPQQTGSMGEVVGHGL